MTFPNFGSDLEMDMNENDAIEYCSDWIFFRCYVLKII